MLPTIEKPILRTAVLLATIAIAAPSCGQEPASGFGPSPENARAAPDPQLAEAAGDKKKRAMEHPNAQTIRRWASAWSAHDYQEFGKLFADNFVYDDAPLQEVFRNHAELKAFYDENMKWAPDFRMVIHSAFATDDFGAAEWTMSGTFSGEAFGMKPTGKSFLVRGASFVSFRNGLVTRWTDYADSAWLYEQLGLSPPKRGSTPPENAKRPEPEPAPRSP